MGSSVLVIMVLGERLHLKNWNQINVTACSESFEFHETCFYSSHINLAEVEFPGLKLLTAEFIPLSLAFLYLNINILLWMGKPFTIIYTRALFGLCNIRTSQLVCEKTMEKVEIILTFRCTVLFYTIGLHSVVQGLVEVPSTHSGVPWGPSFSN